MLAHVQVPQGGQAEKRLQPGAPQTGGFRGGDFSVFGYGAWLGLVFAILLIGVAALRLAVLRRSAP